MADPQHTEATSSLNEIVEQKRALKAALKHLEGTTDPHQLATQLEELYAQLKRHFAAQEAGARLTEVLDDLGPELVGPLEPLSDEHRTVLAAVDDLSTAARSLVDGPLAQIRSGLATLTHQILNTEAIFKALGSTDLPGEVREPRPAYDPSKEGRALSYGPIGEEDLMEDPASSSHVDIPWPARGGMNRQSITEGGESEAEDGIGELYTELARLASESEDNGPDAAREDRIQTAWSRLRHLQEEEARKFEAEFDASLAMPIDAGSRILAEARALRRELEDLTAADAAAEDSVRSSA